eukprot:scaffold671080_cov60-Prasinocladus_malaysianus.AAC.1
MRLGQETASHLIKADTSRLTIDALAGFIRDVSTSTSAAPPSIPSMSMNAVWTSLCVHSIPIWHERRHASQSHAA